MKKGSSKDIPTILLFPKHVGLGVFKTFDILFTFLLAIFTGLFFGVFYVFKFVYKIVSTIVKVLYKYVFKYIFKVLKVIFKYLGKGLKKVFYDIPVRFIRYIHLQNEKSKRKAEARRKAKEKEREKYGRNFGTIGDYFNKKINNLAFVKYYKEQKYKHLKSLSMADIKKDNKKMPVKQTFKYIVQDKEGKMREGYFPAFSKLECYSYLIDEGYTVYYIDTSKTINFIHGENRFTSKMNIKDLIFWLTQLSTYLKSGIPLTDSVKILGEQDKRRKYKKIYSSLVYELTMGVSFAEALEKQGNTFPGLLINMVKAAELIGDIESTLDEMVEYYESIEENRRDIKSALTYPIILLVFAVGVVGFIMIYVIPKFVDVYESAGVELNPITVFVLNLSNFLQNNWIWIILGIVVFILLFKVCYSKIKAFRTVIQFIMMKLPIIGNVVIYKEVTLFSKTFSQLQKSNVLLTDSIEILMKITNNELYKMIMREVVNNLVKGKMMSEVFKDNWMIPEIAYYMIYTGEQTGELAVMLEKVSEFYDIQQKQIINTLKNFLEPLMIAFLAVMVGGVIISVIVPMFSLYGEIT